MKNTINKAKNCLTSLALVGAIALSGCGKSETNTPLDNTSEYRANLVEENTGKEIQKVLSFDSTRGSRTYEFLTKEGDYGYFTEDISRGKETNILLEGFRLTQVIGDSKETPLDSFHRTFLTESGQYIHRIGSKFYITSVDGRILDSGEKLKRTY